MDRPVHPLSTIGVAIGTLVLAASLTPSLIPRTDLLQGSLSGGCFAIGYGSGVALQCLWRYLGCPEMRARSRSITRTIVAVLCLAVVAIFLWRSAEWQNSIRIAMDMSPVDDARPLTICVVALATFGVTLVASRLFAKLVATMVRVLRRFVPRRVANVAGLGMAALLVWSLGSHVLVRSLFGILDRSYATYDRLFETDRSRPTAGGKTGSPASLVKWDELGRAGREFIATGPTDSEIGTFTGRPARQPIRVYVGLGAAIDPAARASLALQELKRVGGFDRSALLIITPTGTGWIDPASMDAVEYLCRGDIASVAVQYSYLSSPLSLLAQPDYGAEASRALFLEVYAYWTTLPKGSRPKLYLNGLSLGAMNSETSIGLFEMIGDPISGVLWSGPPFASRIWRSVSDARNQGSPRWRPVFRDSSLIRFVNQTGPAVAADTPWGPLRIVYLQYASDPIVFFDYRDAYRMPDWMKGPRGPDVSTEFTWFPLVTMLQLALDMAAATAAPSGHGHVYAAKDYVEAWSEVMGREDWSPVALAALKQRLTDGTASRRDERGG